MTLHYLAPVAHMYHAIREKSVPKVITPPIISNFGLSFFI